MRIVIDIPGEPDAVRVGNYVRKMARQMGEGWPRGQVAQFPDTELASWKIEQ